MPMANFTVKFSFLFCCAGENNKCFKIRNSVKLIIP